MFGLNSCKTMNLATVEENMMLYSTGPPREIKGLWGKELNWGPRGQKKGHYMMTMIVAAPTNLMLGNTHDIIVTILQYPSFQQG